MTDEKDASKAAGKLAKLGASKGGKARAAKMTSEQRSAQARAAVMMRWEREGKETPILAPYGAPDRPLRIGPIEIPAYCLADGTSVLAQRGLQAGVGLSRSGGKGGARRLVALMRSLEGKGIDTKDLIARAENPIRFIPTHGGNPADGYEATILPDICAVLIEAGRRGKLLKQQEHLARQAAILQHGFATVGIIAMVHEVTGYQTERQRDYLAQVLQKFIAKELRPWVRTFPAEFYRQIYRLNAWTFSEESNARPGVVGHMTNNVVYRRLAPAILEELKRVTPRDSKGRHKHKLFQRLTEDIGHPKLREYLAGVVMLMKYSPNWATFIDRLDIEHPQWGSNYMLPFPADYDAVPALPPGDQSSSSDASS